ncbi:MAG: PEP/pyruvate-binding domain-containing protein, partial [Candidatus Promineifilaceae bacterium]|nr:PEP/pyruvate-binding domain-containing protein [Candidatus Promineifilaceae bacterium]
MNKLVLLLDRNSKLNVAQAGRKAGSLSELLRAGFPVPPGICLTVSAFELALRPYQAAIKAFLREPETGTGEISELLAGWTLPQAIRTRLFERLPQLGAPDLGFAVRSSAVHEDGTDSSFAGQYTTILGVKSERDIETAVLDCYRSYFSAQAIAARAVADAENGP